MSSLERGLTQVCSILQTCIRDKANCRMKTFCISQAIHNHVNLVTPQLVFNVSSALSRLNQKLIPCDAVPEETSLVSFVTDWMDLIHWLT